MIFSLSKKKAVNYKSIDDLMTFKEGFKVGFYTICVGGLVSLSVIFLFYNTYGKWAQDSLKLGLLDTFSNSNTLNPEVVKDIETIKESEEYRTLNLFTFKQFFSLFSILLSFYVIISALFSQFLKKRVF